MTDYVWPGDLIPFEQSFWLQPHSGGSESPFSRQGKVYGLSAPRWMTSISLRAPDSADRWSSDYATWGERIDAFLDQLRGRQNRVLLWDFRRPGRVPAFVNAAVSAGAATMTLTGAALGDIRVGEFLGGDGRPHRVVDVQASGSNLVVTVEPPFSEDIAAGAAYFQNVGAYFRLADDDSAQNGSAVGELTQYGLSFVEDLGTSGVPGSAYNMTDSTTPVFTAERVAGGISLNETAAANDNLLYPLGLGGTGRRRVILTITPTAGASSINNVGIGVRDGAGGNWLGLGWNPGNGWINGASNGYTGAPGGALIQTTPTFTDGDVLRFQADIDGAGTVYLTVSKNGGSRWNAGVIAPVGELYLFLNVGGLSTFITYSVREQPVSVPAAAPSLFAATPVGTLRARPSGFDAPRIPTEFQVYKQPSVRLFSTNLNLQPQLRESDHTVFIQYVSTTGNDSNTGLKTAPLRSIATALSRIVGWEARAIIKVAGGLYDYSTSWAKTVAKAKVLQVVSADGNPVISSTHDSGLSWSLNSGSTYQATFAQSVTGVFDAAHLTSDGDYTVLALATTLANCQATAGSYFISGTTIYVHASDGRVPDSNIRVYKRPTADGSYANGVFSSPGGVLYMENIYFEGGGDAFRGALSVNTDQATVLGRNCTFKYSGGDTAASAPLTSGDFLAIWQQCISALNSGDGFHYDPNGFGSIAGAGIELDCIGRWNGRSPTAGTNNNSSSHGGTTVRLKTQAGWGDYHHAENRGIDDIFAVQNALSWHLGITSRDSRNSNSNFKIGLGSHAEKQWNDTVTSSGATYDFETLTGATAYLFDVLTGATNTGSGTITTYTP